MSQNTDTRSCTVTSWIVAAVLGLIIAAILVVVGDWRIIQGLFAGIVVAGIVGLLLTFFLCPEGTAKADLEAVRAGERGPNAAGAGAAAAGAAAAGATAAAAGAASAGASSGSADAAAAEADVGSDAAQNAVAGSGDAAGSASEGSAAAEDGAQAASSAASADAGAKVKPSTALAGEADLAARKGSWKYEGEGAGASGAAEKSGTGGDAADADSASSKGTDATGAADDATAGGKKAAASKATASAADAAGDGGAEAEPETLSGPRGTPDDLKRISGVGPKLEGVLNDLGFYHFWQIAAWGPGEVAWVDSRLKFKGRIERDNWIDQAAEFAKEGDA